MRYINKANEPRNFATDGVKLAPNKKLNNLFNSRYRLFEGLIQLEQIFVFIE